MLIDARTLPNDHIIETEICIVGAGAAGITLARALAGQPFRVALLESGGLEPEAETQALYQGSNVGHEYFSLHACRLRHFGGTTNHWEGLCRPLDPIVFEAREWIPDSGWPFDRARLDPYYRAAQPLCGLGPYRYGAADWTAQDRPCLPLRIDRIVTGFFQWSDDPAEAPDRDATSLERRCPVRFGKRYRAELERADNISAYLHANALELETDETVGTVTRVCAATLEGHRFYVSARIFVLATGGIENARLLLLSNSVQKAGLGNAHDLVGRYFAEHIYVYTGQMMLSAAHAARAAYATTRLNGVWVHGFLAPSAATQREARLTNCAFGIGSPARIAGAASLRTLFKALRHGSWPDDLLGHLANVIQDMDDLTAAYYARLLHRRRGAHLHRSGIRYWAEQAPNRNSRVTLSTERDRLGQPKVKLDWRLSAADVYTMKRVHRILAEELGRAGLGRLKIELPDDTAACLSHVHGGYHHMGTTRMHTDPKQGVVDTDCRVHGVANLFIAGSSVFPACGHANPTLTIVAMTLRLADHLKARMA